MKTQRQLSHNSLAILYPELAVQLHPTKNTFGSEITIGSEKVAWWICQNNPDHVWQMKICNRVKAKQSSCTICLSLAVKRPDIASQWHPTKNNGNTPWEIAASSNKKVWWQCLKDKSHVWQASPNARASSKTPSCPMCLGRKLSTSNCLQTLFPEVAAQWDYKRNYPLTPKDVTSGKRLDVFWTCEKGHSWNISIHKRFHKLKSGTKIRGCPVCANKIVVDENSLGYMFPDLASEWHPKNKITSFEITPGSKKEVWWQCKKNKKHEWISPVQSRTRLNKGSKCPYCSGLKILKEDSLATLYPDLAKEYSPKNRLNKDEIAPTYSRKVRWICSKDKTHVWEMPVNSRTKRGMGCPECNSFVYKFPKVANIIDIDKNRQDGIEYKALPPCSQTEIFFKCPNGHAFKSSVVYRTTAAHACPFCKVEKKPSFEYSLEGSFPQLLKEWDYEKNTILPSEVFAGSNIDRYWICSKNHNHLWQASPNARTQKRGGTKCPYCYGNKISKERSLGYRFPETAKLWDEAKNGCSAFEVFAATHKKYSWKCLDNPKHLFVSSPAERIEHGASCKICNSEKMVELLRRWISNHQSKISYLDDIFEMHDLFQKTSRSKLGKAKIANNFFVWAEESGIALNDMIAWSKGTENKIIEKYWKGIRDNIDANLRQFIYKRDGYKCQNPNCKTSGIKDKYISGLSLDHKLPFSMGGKDTEENLHTLCRSCNSSKGTKTWEEFLKSQSSLI